MKTIPTLFSTPMVQAILKGIKTKTRRTKGLEFFNQAPEKYRYDGNDQPDLLEPLDKNYHWFEFVGSDGKPMEAYKSVKCPYGQPGDILWVRETWQQEAEFFEASAHSASYDFDWWESTGKYVYRADGTELPTDSEAFGKWKPSIHMPKEACRLFLKVKSVRVERLKDISRGDAMDEGCPFANMSAGPNPVSWFSELWQSINGEHSWNENPWVWVVEFEKTAKPEDF